MRIQRDSAPGRFVIKVALSEQAVEVGGDLGLNVSIRPLGLDEFGHKVPGLRLHQGPNPPGGQRGGRLLRGFELPRELPPVGHIVLSQEFVAPEIDVRRTQELRGLGRLLDLAFEADELAPLDEPLAV